MGLDYGSIFRHHRILGPSLHRAWFLALWAAHAVLLASRSFVEFMRWSRRRNACREQNSAQAQEPISEDYVHVQLSDAQEEALMHSDHGKLTAPASALAQRRLVLADDFDYDGLPCDARWEFQTDCNSWVHKSSHKELQWYVSNRLKNAFVDSGDGGRLHIRALHEPELSSQRDGCEYSSARLRTKGKMDWCYGRYARGNPARGTDEIRPLTSSRSRWSARAQGRDLRENASLPERPVECHLDGKLRQPIWTMASERGDRHRGVRRVAARRGACVGAHRVLQPSPKKPQIRTDEGQPGRRDLQDVLADLDTFAHHGGG